MTQSIIPKGQRYSLVYSDKGLPGRDSPRARKRMYHAISKTIEIANTSLKARPIYGRVPQIDFDEIPRRIQSELGVNVPYNGFYDLERFITNADLQDFLDTITICANFFGNNGVINVSKFFIDEMARILGELNLAYTLDASGGVHPIIDREFEAGRVAAISLLSTARYSGALKAFDAAHSALEQTPLNGKNAIRNIYESIEIIFKLMFPKADRIGEAELKKNLEPFLQKKYGADKAALGASIRLSNGLSDWVNAAHWYRHGQGTEEATEPPDDLVVTLMGTGSGYLRWLAEMDNQATKQ